MRSPQNVDPDSLDENSGVCAFAGSWGRYWGRDEGRVSIRSGKSKIGNRGASCDKRAVYSVIVDGRR